MGVKAKRINVYHNGQEEEILALKGSDWTPTSDELNEIAENAADKLQPQITEIAQNVDSIRSGAEKGETALQSVPLANASTIGGFKVATWSGITVNPADGNAWINNATNSQIDNRSSAYNPINSAMIDYAVKAALTDGKGAAYTDAEKAAVRERVGASTEISKSTSLADTIISSDLSEYRLNISGYNRIDAVVQFASDRSANANLFIRFKEKNEPNDNNLAAIWVNSNYTSAQIHIYRVGNIVFCDTATSTTDNNQSIRYAGFAITDKDISEFVINYGAQKIPTGSRIVVYGS